MQILVRAQQIAVEEGLRTHIERRLEFSLGRFSPRITRATVRLTDVNGPRGGEDKACRVDVRLRPTGAVFVADRDADLRVAVDRVADRLGRSVAKALKRDSSRERRKRRDATASRPGTDFAAPDKKEATPFTSSQGGEGNALPTL